MVVVVVVVVFAFILLPSPLGEGHGGEAADGQGVSPPFLFRTAKIRHFFSLCKFLETPTAQIPQKRLFWVHFLFRCNVGMAK